MFQLRLRGLETSYCECRPIIAIPHDSRLDFQPFEGVRFILTLRNIKRPKNKGFLRSSTSF